MQPVTCEQGERHGQQPQDLAHAQRMLAEDLQHVGEQGDAGAEEDKPDYIERASFLFAIVRQVQIDHQQTEYADGYVDVKDESPMESSRR